MESNTENSELEAATRALKARMARAASLHLKQVDARTSIVLQEAGVLKRGVTHFSIPAEVLEILTNISHPLRIPVSPGPFIFYKDTTNPNQQYVLDIVSVLLSAHVTSRSAAISHLELMATSESPKLTPKTKKILQIKGGEVINENPEVWQPAALEVHDVIADDLFYQLAAVEQSLEQHFEDGLRDYFPKILRPSISSLEALELRLVKPSEQKTEMATLLSECANRNSLQEACNEYLRIAGFLPFAEDYSLAQMVKLWRERHNTQVNIWEVLWHWADETRSGLARYHVSMTFLSNPEWGVQGRERVVWQEILEIISNPADKDDSLKWQDEWTVRKELAQHYLHFLESRSPGALSEPLATFAWWLAERVGTLIGHTAEASSNLRNVAIIPEAASSDFAWKLSLPRVAPSVLAKATHLGASLWALSALNRMRAQTLEMLSPGLDEQVANRFEQNFAAVIMFGFPLKAVQPEDMVYAFETTLSESVKAWRTYREGSLGGDRANGIASMYAKLANPAEFAPALRKIYEEDEMNQMIIAFWAKSLALQDAIPEEEVWKCLTDDEWRKPAFTKIVDPALDQLFIAFSLASQSSNTVWKSGLAHLYASACEEVGDNAERRRVLFALTALSGIHTYSVSALQRLLASSQRATYLEMLTTLRNALLNDRSNPPWLTARIRAVLAATAAS